MDMSRWRLRLHRQKCRAFGKDVSPRGADSRLQMRFRTLGFIGIISCLERVNRLSSRTAINCRTAMAPGRLSLKASCSRLLPFVTSADCNFVCA